MSLIRAMRAAWSDDAAAWSFFTPEGRTSKPGVAKRTPGEKAMDPTPEGLHSGVDTTPGYDSSHPDSPQRLASSAIAGCAE
jgi:hypothetical protein